MRQTSHVEPRWVRVPTRRRLGGVKGVGREWRLEAERVEVSKGR